MDFVRPTDRQPADHMPTVSMCHSNRRSPNTSIGLNYSSRPISSSAGRVDARKPERAFAVPDLPPRLVPLASLKPVKGIGEVVVNNGKCVVVKAKASGTGLQLSAPDARRTSMPSSGLRFASPRRQSPVRPACTLNAAPRIRPKVRRPMKPNSRHNALAGV